MAMNNFLFFYFQTKAYREFIVEKRNTNLLTEEDKYLMQLGRVERLSSKLSIMSYLGNFFDNLHLITPVSTMASLFIYQSLQEFSKNF